MTIDETPNLKLFAPDSTNLVRNWNLYHELNMDNLDARLGPLEAQTYVPVLGTNDGSPINVGDTGYVTGFWTRYFDLIYVWGMFKFAGSGIVIPNDSNAYFTFSMPVPARAIFGADSFSATSGRGIRAGLVFARDASSAITSRPGNVQFINSTAVSFNKDATEQTSRSWRYNVPFDWATDDRATFMASYIGDI